ncbi:unnamed protein product, partial [Larinioides sclopetarius]
SDEIIFKILSPRKKVKSKLDEWCRLFLIQFMNVQTGVGIKQAGLY